MTLTLFDMLDRGYFPKELPPPFNTTGFAQAVAGVGVTLPPDTFKSRPNFSECCSHNLVRTGGLRRNLGIPNPKHFFRLADHVSKNWNYYYTHVQSSPFSLTKPVVSSTDRAISPQHNLSERIEHRARLRTSGRFLLKADILRFFPSIYTHSIPWAFMGKKAAKSAMGPPNTLAGTWQDEADILARSINNNQTIGIPIGPDTSRLIAEVLLAHIDVALSKKFRRLNGIRYIDDYEFVFPLRSEAEEVLGYLQHLLNEFELALNPSKTSIVELPTPLENLWTSRIRVFPFRNLASTSQKHDLTAYFDLLFELLRSFPEEGLMKYAVARLRSEDISKDNWKYFENILIHCVTIEPACIPQVCDQVFFYKSREYPIAKSRWSAALNRIVTERVPLGQSSEAAWAMWLMKLLNIKLLARSAKTIGEDGDSVVSLMALGLAELGLASFSHLNALHRYANSAGLFGSQWLLCYQGNLMKWLGSQSGRATLQHDPTFKLLESKNVSFFDINVSLPTPPSHATPNNGGGGGGFAY
jgi:hypothetical protein